MTYISGQRCSQLCLLSENGYASTDEEPSEFSQASDSRWSCSLQKIFTTLWYSCSYPLNTRKHMWELSFSLFLQCISNERIQQPGWFQTEGTAGNIHLHIMLQMFTHISFKSRWYNTHVFPSSSVYPSHQISINHCDSGCSCICCRALNFIDNVDVTVTVRVAAFLMFNHKVAV